MKLRNKKTGEILEEARSSMVYKDNFRIYDNRTDKYFTYNSLAELNEEWEDYEDNDLSKIIEWIDKGLEGEELPVSVNDFVDELKAWKRLKDKGFRFTDYDYTTYNGKGCGQVFFNDVVDNINEIKADLDLLFGGEE